MPRSPLHHTHERLGARFTDFGGWEMPLQYEGTLAEHRAVRSSCGVFDVSHLGRFRLSGPHAAGLLSRLLCNDIDRIAPGRAQYSMLLDERAGVVDDLIVWWVDAEEFVVLPNAANNDAVHERFAAAAGGDTEVTDLRADTALLAVQGPGSAQVLDAVVGSHPGRFRVADHDGMLGAGTGYTGEPGAEIVVPLDRSEAVFDALVAAGGVPCGLGARDTLRLEMGYPLWGQDLDLDTTPLEAGLDWVVGWDHDFTGRDALARQREQGLRKRLIGFVMEDRPIPRHGYPLRASGSAGTVSSGNFAPSLGVGIGMGYLSPDPGDAPEDVEVSIRGDWVAARAADPPFLER